MGNPAEKMNQYSSGRTSLPPGGVKLANALRELLKDKDFNSITTAEISRTAGSNEALIYRYFKDKRGLLHQILFDYLEDFNAELMSVLKETEGALNKIRRLIRAHINIYDTNRVFAKILLLEVRNFPGYFESDTYRMVKFYGRLLTDVISKGVEDGEIRDDISPARIRDLILGGIEHFCMAPVIFGREISTDAVSEELCDLVFKGIENKIE